MRRPEAYEALATHFAISEKHKTALRGRLQHFQRLGFPAGVNTGKGKPAEYDSADLIQMCAALHLNLSGFMPEAAVEIVRSNRVEILGDATAGKASTVRVVGQLRNSSPTIVSFDVSGFAA